MNTSKQITSLSSCSTKRPGTESKTQNLLKALSRPRQCRPNLLLKFTRRSYMYDVRGFTSAYRFSIQYREEMKSDFNRILISNYLDFSLPFKEIHSLGIFAEVPAGCLSLFLPQ